MTRADYVSCRDRNSAAIFAGLTGREAVTTADLVFLNDSLPRNTEKGAKETLRVCVVLRSSIADSARIAADLVAMADEIENLQLFPVAFQLGEDERVWRAAGWKGEIMCPDDPGNVFHNADLVISMRLHGCIIAANAGVPWIGIAYDPKVEAFAASCRWKFCCLPQDMSRGYLEEKINLLAVKRSEYADRLNRSIGEKRRILQEDFAGLEKILMQRA